MIRQDDLLPPKQGLSHGGAAPTSWMRGVPGIAETRNVAEQPLTDLVAEPLSGPPASFIGTNMLDAMNLPPSPRSAHARRKLPDAALKRRLSSALLACEAGAADKGLEPKLGTRES